MLEQVSRLVIDYAYVALFTGILGALQRATDVLRSAWLQH